MKHQTREKYEKKGREIGPHTVGPLTSQQLQSSQACFFIPAPPPPVNEYLINVLMQMGNTGLRGTLDNSQGWELSENAAAIPHHIGLFKHSLRIMFCFKWGTLSMMFLESYRFKLGRRSSPSEFSHQPISGNMGDDDLRTSPHAWNPQSEIWTSCLSYYCYPFPLWLCTETHLCYGKCFVVFKNIIWATFIRR